MRLFHSDYHLAAPRADMPAPKYGNKRIYCPAKFGMVRVQAPEDRQPGRRRAR